MAKTNKAAKIKGMRAYGLCRVRRDHWPDSSYQAEFQADEEVSPAQVGIAPGRDLRSDGVVAGSGRTRTPARNGWQHPRPLIEAII